MPSNHSPRITDPAIAPSKFKNFKSIALLVLTSGFSVFAIFFGAGNLVFPINVGIESGTSWEWGMLGLLISDPGVPLLGMFALYFFDGDYRDFLKPLGKYACFILPLLILSLIGPFGVIPRCITVAYGSFVLIAPETPQWLFNAISILVIASLFIRSKEIVGLIGSILTPVLLISLIFILYQGIAGSTPPDHAHIHLDRNALFNGLAQGYQTMDLMGSIFLSILIIDHIQRSFKRMRLNYAKKQLTTIHLEPSHSSTLIAMTLGMGLLGLIYAGLVYLGAAYKDVLIAHPQEMAIGVIAHETLGRHAGTVVCLAVALTCLTTALAVTAVCVQYIREVLTPSKPLRKRYCVAIILAISFPISLGGFKAIASTLGPLLEIIYPALILHTLLVLTAQLSKVQIAPKVYQAFFVVGCLLQLGYWAL